MNTVTIPMPQKVLQRRTGLYSTGDINATDNKVRLSPIDAEKVNKAAEMCGVNKSAFMRWCSVFCAEEIINSYNKQTGRTTEVIDF